jgi:hypothetical protein
VQVTTTSSSFASVRYLDCGGRETPAITRAQSRELHVVNVSLINMPAELRELRIPVSSGSRFKERRRLALLRERAL